MSVLELEEKQIHFAMFELTISRDNSNRIQTRKKSNQHHYIVLNFFNLVADYILLTKREKKTENKKTQLKSKPNQVQTDGFRLYFEYLITTIKKKEGWYTRWCEIVRFDSILL